MLLMPTPVPTVTPNSEGERGSCTWRGDTGRPSPLARPPGRPPVDADTDIGDSRAVVRMYYASMYSRCIDVL